MPERRAEATANAMAIQVIFICLNHGFFGLPPWMVMLSLVITVLIPISKVHHALPVIYWFLFILSVDSPVIIVDQGTNAEITARVCAVSGIELISTVIGDSLFDPVLEIHDSFSFLITLHPIFF